MRVVGNWGERKKGENNTEGELTATETISRAEAYRLLSFLIYDRTERKKLVQAESPFTDLKPEEETYEYFCAMKQAGLLGDTKKARPEEAMTCGEFRDALVALCQTKAGQDNFSYSEIIQILPERLKIVKEEDPLRLGEFLCVYQNLLAQGKSLKRKPQIKEQELYLFADETMEQNADEDAKDRRTNAFLPIKVYSPEGKALWLSFCADYSGLWGQPENESQAGVFTPAHTTGKRYLSAEDCLDRSLRVLVCGNEIICCIGEGTGETVLYNALIQSGKDSEMLLYASGFERKFPTSLPLSEEITSTIGDITLKHGKITAVTIKPDVITGKVLLADKTQIEVEGYGKLPLDANYKIYKTYGELMMEQTSSILVGYTVTDFVVADGKICAALMKESIRAENIRVLIKTTGYTSNYHDSVTVTANRAFHVESEAGIKEYEKEKELTYTPEQIQKAGGRLRIWMDSESGKLSVSSVRRSCGTPAYRGSIELVADDQGILIINELPLEEYLYAVIPSEMPTSYGIEALKAQAVCARSYAYNQLVANRYSAYGAHVDDSVNCQVYNNIAEDETSILAVKDTYGKVAEYAGNIITTYYFSTSFGHTTNIEDVWENGAPAAYLTGSLQTESEPKLDLTKEEAFREFLLSDTISAAYSNSEVKEVVTTYDSDINWYRWNVTISAEDLSKQVNSQLKKRYQAGKSQILTKVSEEEAESMLAKDSSLVRYEAGGDSYVSCEPEEIGTIQEAVILERGAGGIATSLRLTGSKGTVLIRYQTNIRTLLAPVEDTIYRKDGSTTSGMQLLPSAFITIDAVTQEKEPAFLISGGGYGHGLGMSQNGARSMAALGKSFEEILKHYYPDTNIGFLYEEAVG